MINENLVFVTRHYQCRIEVFSTKILMTCDRLGKITYYAVRAEFQFLGSLHSHSFFWKLNPVNLSKQQYRLF